MAFEVLATWVAPWLMGQIGPVRAGLGLNGWQVTMLVAGIAVFWVFDDKPVISASGRRRNDTQPSGTERLEPLCTDHRPGGDNLGKRLASNTARD